MVLRNLNSDETEVVRKCLKCIADGKVILHDWEFQTIMGITTEEFLNIYELWPEVDEKDELVEMAIANSMNNLIGYPHGKHHCWAELMDVPISKIIDVFTKWKGSQIGSYFDGIQ